MPTFIEPMLASPLDKPFDNKNWLFEIKYDGFRIIAYVARGAVTLRTRKNKDFTAKFLPVSEALRKWNISAVVDGEVVVLNKKGVSDFLMVL